MFALSTFTTSNIKLYRPTDFFVLESLEEHSRNVAPDVAHHTGKSRKNNNTRLPVLADYGLVTKIGPADTSNLYDITERGSVVLELRDRYENGPDFEQLVEERLQERR